MRSLAIASGLFLASAALAQAADIAIHCGAQPEELRLCREGAEAWAKESGNTVRVLSAPESSTERYFLYLDLLGRRDAGVDVLQIDVIWPSALAQHLLDLKPLLPPDATM